MSADIWALVGAAVGGGGLAGVATTLITGLMSRPRTRADAVALLTDSALKQVNELQERTAEAEREARATRSELEAARTQIRELTADVHRVLAQMHAWRTAILAPTADLERLRSMVLTDPGRSVNGRHL